MNIFRTALVVVIALSIIGCAHQQPVGTTGTTVTFPSASVGVNTEIKIVNQRNGKKVNIFDFRASGSTPKIKKKF